MTEYEKDITLEQLAEAKWLSNASISVCRRNALNSLVTINSYYKKNGSFKDLINCDKKQVKELNEVFKQYHNLSNHELIDLINDREEIKKTITHLNQLKIDSLNRQIDYLLNKLSVRARNGLFSLFGKTPVTNELIETLASPSFNFYKIRNIGEKTVFELQSFFEQLSLFIKSLKSFDNDHVIHLNAQNVIQIAPRNNWVEIINDFNPFKKATLNRHVEYLIANLGVRARNGITQFFGSSINTKDLVATFFSPLFSFHEIKNIGNKSVEELEKLKLELQHFIEGLKYIDQDQLNKEHAKLILQTTFSNLPRNFDEQFEQVFSENGKLKLFTLLNFLVESGQLFSETEKSIFELSYSNDNSREITFELIAKQQDLSRERVRQIKSKLEENIQSYFLFISNLIVDELVSYSIDSSKVFQHIDKPFARKINESEGVNFNITFYSVIFGIFLNKSHSILGDNEVIYGKRKTANKKKYQNCYLINTLLFKCFDFESFVEDIYLKVNDRISEPYSLNLKGYIYDFLKEEGKPFFEEIQFVCEAILFSEFELAMNSDGYLLFEQNTKKSIHHYYYEILEENGDLMTVTEITNVANKKFPFLESKGTSVRGILNKEKSHFIYFGRSSTYGLRKWEDEKENLKGGTIRDIVEEYLLKKDSPKHITEILNYVLRYRPDTNEKSVLSNIKVDESKKFVFFKRGFVGIKNKTYDDHYIKISITLKGWDAKFSELKSFREKNKNKWPSASSLDQNERALYLFGYKSRKAYHTGKLDAAKEQLLRSLDFPLEATVSRANDWKTEAKKLMEFQITEKRWPSANSPDKNERALYRFCYLSKKAYQNNQLSKEKIELLIKLNFNFNLLK